jgi:hypothetical protein
MRFCFLAPQSNSAPPLCDRMRKPVLYQVSSFLCKPRDTRPKKIVVALAAFLTLMHRFATRKGVLSTPPLGRIGEKYSIDMGLSLFTCI